MSRDACCAGVEDDQRAHMCGGESVISRYSVSTGVPAVDSSTGFCGVSGAWKIHAWDFSIGNSRRTTNTPSLNQAIAQTMHAGSNIFGSEDANSCLLTS